MNLSTLKAALLIATGFAAGLLAANLPSAIANTSPSEPDMSKKEFSVSINEIKQNFVFGETFVGSYQRDVMLSDKEKRSFELTPMIHDGMQVVGFKDTGGHTYVGLNGTTTNGTLMVQLRDVAEMKRHLAGQGWER